MAAIFKIPQFSRQSQSEYMYRYIYKLLGETEKNMCYNSYNYPKKSLSSVDVKSSLYVLL